MRCEIFAITFLIIICEVFAATVGAPLDYEITCKDENGNQVDWLVELIKPIDYTQYLIIYIN